MEEYRREDRKEAREKRKAKREKQVRLQIVAATGVVLLAVVVVLCAFFVLKENRRERNAMFSVSGGQWEQYEIGSPVRQVPQPLLDVQLLTVNEFSRPGILTDGIRGIVVHYTANPGSTAQNNRDYFENLKDTQENQVSSNFVIGLEGEVIQCIPTSEIAYASNSRNNDTVSIECCHPDETGAFTEETYQSLVELTAFLCGKFNLTPDDVIRHYDVTEKICPKYFVEHEDAWQAFRTDVARYISEHGA